MTAESSWTDRLLPEWLGGSSETPAAGTGGDSGPEHRRLLDRILQQRDGLEDALLALPGDYEDIRPEIRESADEFVRRARTAADRLEAASTDGPGMEGSDGAERMVSLLREGTRALHESHFRVVKIRVARDQEAEAEADQARDGLGACLDEMSKVSSSLEELLSDGESA